MQSRPVRNRHYSNYKGGKRKKKRRGGRGGKRGGGRITGAQIAGMLASSGFKYLFNTEDKYQDIAITTTVDNSGLVTLLNGLTQGTTVSTRIGDSVKWVNITVSWSLTISVSAATTFVRIILFRDKQCDGAAPNTFVNLLMSASYDALYNPVYSNRFVVIYDNKVGLNTGDDQVYVGDRSFNQTFHTRYGLGNAGTIADIATNSCYLALISDQPTNRPAFLANIRVMFVDN